MARVSHEKYDLEIVGQSHRIQHSQWSHSIGNIYLYKSHTEHFSPTLADFQIFAFQNVG